MKLTQEEFDKFLARLTLNLREKGELRVGQAMFNALFFVKPELAEEIGGTLDDPFYDDKRVTSFVTKIKP